MQKVLGIVAVLVIVLGGYFYFTEYRAAAPMATEKVVIAQAFDVFLYAPLYVALEQGFFAEEGLEVEIVTAGGDEKAFASLVGGDAQFAVGDPTFVAIAGEKGQKGVVVSAILNGVPFWGITKSSTIPRVDTPADLGTHSVATFPAPSTAYALQKKMFENAGLQPNIREVAFGALIPALENGSVDIALELEPNVSTAVANGSRILYSLSSYYPEFALTGLIALPAYVEEHGATAQKVVNALTKASLFIEEDPQAAADILAQRFPDVSSDVAAQALKNITDAKVISSDLVVGQAAWDAAIELRRASGDLKSDAAFATYVDNTFAEAAAD